MALHSFAVVVVVVLVSCLLAPPAIKAQPVNISTYWGTTCAEGSLIDACKTKWYGIVNIGFVDKFGNNRTPTLNTCHCNPLAGECKYLGAEIQECQNRGIKVMISIGGPGGDYSLTSPDDVEQVEQYLWFSYLGGHKSDVDRPFGDDATLDGVDFFIEGNATKYWDEVAVGLRSISNVLGTPIELSATPGCQYSDHYLDPESHTENFDYVQVRFYNETGCQYNGNFDAMKSAWGEWNQWTAKNLTKKIFVGVTAFEEGEGYIDTCVLLSEFLPYARTFPKFGGVMVWNFFSDRVSRYSPTIKCVGYAIQTILLPE